MFDDDDDRTYDNDDDDGDDDDDDGDDDDDDYDCDFRLRDKAPLWMCLVLWFIDHVVTMFVYACGAAAQACFRLGYRFLPTGQRRCSRRGDSSGLDRGDRQVAPLVLSWVHGSSTQVCREESMVVVGDELFNHCGDMLASIRLLHIGEEPWV